MSTGFIYVVATARCNYCQCGPLLTPPDYHEVPLDDGGKLFFGFCKQFMRPRMNVGDFIFGISPSGRKPRRIIFAVQIDKDITFAQAYHSYPRFRTQPCVRNPHGVLVPCNPGIIEVEPVRRLGFPYPHDRYQFICGSIHDGIWDKHLLKRDAFFVCEPATCPTNGVKLPSWLGPNGPDIADPNIFSFLQSCSVWGQGNHGRGAMRSATNAAATHKRPVGGGTGRGLHLETNNPQQLIGLICQAMQEVGHGLPPQQPVVPDCSGNTIKSSNGGPPSKSGRKCS